MTPAHGTFCDGFPEPQHPFESSPFFGKYSRTGGAGTSSYDYDQSYSQPEYDPRYYEAPPQPAPEPVQPEQEQLAPPADEAPAPPGQGGGVPPGQGGTPPGQDDP